MTAIIDGMGSIGAAIGPLMTGYISGAAGVGVGRRECFAANKVAGRECDAVCSSRLRAAHSPVHHPTHPTTRRAAGRV